MRVINCLSILSPQPDEVADINSDCDRSRARCQCANHFIRNISWIDLKQLQSVCEKILLAARDIRIELWLVVLRLPFVLLSSRPRSITDVPSHAATLRQVTLSHIRRNVQQFAKPDVGISKQPIWPIIDTSLRRWDFKSDDFNHGTRLAELSIGLVGRFRRSRRARSAVHHRQHAMGSNHDPRHEHAGWRNAIAQARHEMLHG